MFDARVDENLTAEREITDVASATFVAPSLNKQLSALSSPATITVVPTPQPPPPEADLATATSETVAPSPGGGDAVDSHILIEDRGPADATDVIMHATVPPGAVIDSVTTDQGSCSISGNEITCVVPHMDSGGSVDVNVVVVEPTADSAAGSTTEATATAAQFDPTPANNSAEASAPEPAPAGATQDAALAVDVHDSSATVPLGGTETESITITNNGPDTATAVDITDALGAAAELIAVNPGSASCAPGLPLQCTIATLPAGSSQTIALEVRPLRAGNLIEAATISGDQFDPLLATESALGAARITPRRTAARLRIVPVRPVRKAGQSVEFVVTAGLTKSVPGVKPKICVALPAGLRLISAPGATSGTSRLCWSLTDLISGRPQSFRFQARVSAVPSSGANFAVQGQLTGANFASTRAMGAVLAPPRVVACPSSAVTDPWARIAC
jgi:uncharacterized repeat protein (TIGR01451 family)